MCSVNWEGQVCSVNWEGSVCSVNWEGSDQVFMTHINLKCIKA